MSLKFFWCNFSTFIVFYHPEIAKFMQLFLCCVTIMLFSNFWKYKSLFTFWIISLGSTPKVKLLRTNQLSVWSVTPMLTKMVKLIRKCRRYNFCLNFNHDIQAAYQEQLSLVNKYILSRFESWKVWHKIVQGHWVENRVLGF